MRSTSRSFTEEQDQFICANYRSMLARDIAIAVGKSTTAIRKRAGKLGLAVPLKRWCDEEDAVIRSGWGNKQLRDIARQLGRSISETSSRAKRIGCIPWRIRKGTHAGRPVDGFANGRPVYTHRAVIEKIIGRKLRSNEVVHHIDANKFNNDPSNLYVFSSRSSHRKAHSALESIVPTLLERGYIRFNHLTGVYELCETSK